MYKIALVLLFILYSCIYPDIDSVPNFDALKITMEEKIDKCKNNNIFNKIKEDCFKQLKNIIDRL